MRVPGFYDHLKNYGHLNLRYVMKLTKKDSDIFPIHLQDTFINWDSKVLNCGSYSYDRTTKDDWKVNQ